MIVADASAIVQCLLNPAVVPGIAAVFANEESVAAPALVDYEVMSALRRLVLAREVSEPRAAATLHALARMRIDRYEIERLADRIWSLRHNLTVYDAAYVALAERLGAPLHTLDRKLSGAPGHKARVIFHGPAN